mmetsp:Transcript_42587/g.112386  ORF Transcript_42587/g.112386 Transcript_42587/m.112386 type:complete len:203 (-) Transcript_42587:617-1225(-)
MGRAAPFRARTCRCRRTCIDRSGTGDTGNAHRCRVDLDDSRLVDHDDPDSTGPCLPTCPCRTCPCPSRRHRSPWVDQRSRGNRARNLHEGHVEVAALADLLAKAAAGPTQPQATASGRCRHRSWNHEVLRTTLARVRNWRTGNSQAPRSTSGLRPRNWRAMRRPVRRKPPRTRYQCRWRSTQVVPSLLPQPHRSSGLQQAQP